ncbi:MAG: UvrD-helicase domain-containing protein [Spirochaetia bacterium]
MSGDSPEKTALPERIAALPPLSEGRYGTYVLALHEITEWLISGSLPAPPEAGFAALLKEHGKRLKAGGRATGELSVLGRIAAEHEIALHAMGAAEELDVEEARGATHNFLRFCALSGIENPALETLKKKLSSWKRKHSLPEEQPSVLSGMRADLSTNPRDMGKLLAQTVTWAQDKQRLAELEGETMRIASALAREAAQPGGEARRVELEADRAALEEEKRTLTARLEGYRDLDRYVQHVSRFSLYTRTRIDYERGVMELTPEQNEALEGIRPGFDFLIRGGAGTGKTIVLLHALGRMKGVRESELDLRPGTRILFLTYTSTLVKYDRYVAEILKENEADGLIFTADSFFLSRLTLLGQAQRVDYAVMARLAEKHNSTGFYTAQELAVEIEEFLFGNLVTRGEYVEQMIQRRGMRQPLSAGQRAAVWGIREKIVEEMEHDGLLSRNYSRLKLIEHMSACPDDPALKNLDVAFVDESQDLCAADLRALKLMTHRGLVMAGDTGQSIYGVGSPYRRAGVDIAGRSRVLHTSFRNTIPIHEVTEAYRKLSGLDDDEAAGTTAFREGPVPELYMAPSREELARLLLRKAALFIDRLGYDPENLTVLAPTRTDLATIGDMLGHAGYQHANIRDDDFSFKQRKTIRLSTLHSSKGLDFAVVLLYLPALSPRTDYDEKTGDTLTRNLIYVAMTRAMDNLNVFTLEGAHEAQHEEPLQDLLRVFARSRAAQGG